MDISSEQIKTFVGYAVADKENDSRTLKVYCPELQPFLKGELTGVQIDTPVSTSDGNVTYNGSVKSINYVTCEYRSQQSDRLTPPDVRRGEKIIVTMYGDSNTSFYWDTAGVDTGTRRTERVIIGANDTLKYNEALTEANAYCLIFDTRNRKVIRLATCKSDGEQYSYYLSLEPDNNRMVMSDDNDNTIWINTANSQVMMSNHSGSLLNLENENIVMSCKGNITIDAKGGDITMHSGNDTYINVGANFSQFTKGSYSSMVLGSISFMTADTYACNALSSITFNTLDDYNLLAAKSVSLLGGVDVSVLGVGESKIVGGANLSLSSTGTASFGGGVLTSIASPGIVEMEAGAAMTAKAGATMSLSSAAALSLSAGAGLSLSFVGAGVCSSVGGALTMKVANLNIIQG